VHHFNATLFLMLFIGALSVAISDCSLCVIGLVVNLLNGIIVAV
jgi:hypothetical protein